MKEEEERSFAQERGVTGENIDTVVIQQQSKIY